MTAFGKDYCTDYDVVYQMDREGLILSLLSVAEDNAALEFSREFLERYDTSKLRHIMWDAVKETFYSHWEDEERKLFENERHRGIGSESSGN